MAYTALYNRYRPQHFSGVIGQQAIVRVLKNQVQMGMVSHAYLFSGPRGTGKTTMARIFAKAINCTDPQEGELCGSCDTCLALSAKNNLDIVEIDAASNTGVNDIRTLRENVKYMPVSGSYRVYIIDEVHMLSVNAFNALLKTLEEPPEHIVFIMATTEPHKLPVTVLSRCQKFEFTRISTSYIAKYLEVISKDLKIKADSKALYAIARAAAGGMRDALSLLDQMIAIGDSVIDTKLVSETLGSADKLLYFALCEAILNEDISRAIGGLNAMIQKGCSASTIASDMIQMFRDLYIAQNSIELEDELMLDETSIERLRSLSSKVSSGSVIKCLEIFSMLENDLRYAARPEIWLELAIGKACRVQKEQSYEAMLERIESLEKKLTSGVVPKAQVKITPIARQDQDEFFPIRDEDFSEKQEDIPKVNNEATIAIDSDSENVEIKTDEAQSVQIEDRAAKIDKDQEIDNENMMETADDEIIEDSPQGIDEGRRIWSKAIDKVRTQKIMRLISPMKKAKVSGYDGKTLFISFSEADEVSAKRLENNELKDILNKAIKEAAGKHILFSSSVEKLSEEDSEFMKQVYDVFPDDIVSIE